MRKQSLAVAMMALTAVGTGMRPAATWAREGSKVAIPLTGTGIDDDASAKSEFHSSAGRSKFQVKVKHIEIGHTFSLKVGGVTRSQKTSNSAGAISFKFTDSPSGSSEALDFDPRGEEIEIDDNGTIVLSTDDGTPGNPTGSSIDESAALRSTALQPTASGKARLRERKGKRTFKVEVEDVIDGTYDLAVDSVVKATLTVSGGLAEVEFASPTDDPGKLPLDFDPLGKLIQVMQGSSVVLSGNMLASAPGVNTCTPSEGETALSNLGVDPDASGDVRLRLRDDCRISFSVEAEDLPLGAYEVVVGGMVRGTLDVVADIGGTKGEIEFSSDPDEVGEIPLEFDPTGALVEIRQGAVVYLSGTPGTTPSGTCSDVDVQPSFASSGADSDASGDVRFRQDVDCSRNLKISADDLNVGSYDVVIGGVVRGSLSMVVSGGGTEGELEFETEPVSGQLLLDFDPRGQLVEILQGSTSYLSLTLPN